jgi:UDP-N-acetylmuramyl pentapeptide phosphotransferase/UDP-N-acetylglucosamine-1-phosphate transferase
MGDTGSMALGSVLAVVALMTGQWPMLLVIGIIPLAEMLERGDSNSVYFRMQQAAGVSSR